MLMLAQADEHRAGAFASFDAFATARKNRSRSAIMETRRVAWITIAGSTAVFCEHREAHNGYPRALGILHRRAYFGSCQEPYTMAVARKSSAPLDLAVKSPCEELRDDFFLVFRLIMTLHAELERLFSSQRNPCLSSSLPKLT